MSITTTNMNLPVTIDTTFTNMWLGKYDDNGEMMDERVYSASASILGQEIATTSSGSTHKSEKSAIRAVKQQVKDVFIKCF